MYAIQKPSSQNVTVVVEILGALANSPGSRQIEAVNNIMHLLLLELEKKENIHLFSGPTGMVTPFYTAYIHGWLFIFTACQESMGIHSSIDSLPSHIPSLRLMLGKRKTAKYTSMPLLNLHLSTA